LKESNNNDQLPKPLVGSSQKNRPGFVTIFENKRRKLTVVQINQKTVNLLQSRMQVLKNNKYIE
jgi:hypothetical protein